MDAGTFARIETNLVCDQLLATKAEIISCRNVKNTHYRFQGSILEYMYNDEFGINLGQQWYIVQCVKEDYVLLSLLRIGSVKHL